MSFLEKWVSLVVLSCWWAGLDMEVLNKSPTSSYLKPLLEGFFLRKGKKERIKTNSWLRSQLRHDLETFFLYFVVLPNQFQGLSGLSWARSLVCDRSFIYPIYPNPGWLGWFHTMTLCRLWQPIPVWGCWAILDSWGWVHSWAGAVGVFPLGQSHSFKQTSSLCSTTALVARGMLVTWSYFFQEKHWFELIVLELTRIRIYGAKQGWGLTENHWHGGDSCGNKLNIQSLRNTLK